MMQAARSTANTRQQAGAKAGGPLARRMSALQAGNHASLRDFGSVVGGDGLGGEETKDEMQGNELVSFVGNRARFREALMQAEELAIRKLRQQESRSGGWRLRVFGIGKTFGGLPGSKLIHPQAPFASGLLIVSGDCHIQGKGGVICRMFHCMHAVQV